MHLQQLTKPYYVAILPTIVRHCVIGERVRPIINSQMFTTNLFRNHKILVSEPQARKYLKNFIVIFESKDN